MMVSSAIFGAFMCLCALIFLYDAALYVVLRKKFLLWHALRALMIGIAAATANGMPFPSIVKDPVSRLVLHGGAADLSIVVLAPFVLFFLEKNYVAGNRRHLLGASSCLALAAFILSPFIGTSKPIFIAHSALISASLLAMVVAILTAYRQGSRGAFFLTIALPTTMLLAAGLIIYGLIFNELIENWIMLVMPALTIEFIVTAAAQGDHFMTKAREVERTQREMHRVLEANRTDPLTGLPNRRALEALFDPSSDTLPNGIALVDLDFFKSINDSFGHDAGDAVLVAVGEALAEEGIFAARLGGEEFILVLYGRDWAKQAERARRRISCHVARSVRELDVPVTASAGLAKHRRGDSLASTMKRADLALYAAKDSGRNRSLALTFFDEFQPSLTIQRKRTAA